MNIPNRRVRQVNQFINQLKALPSRQSFFFVYNHTRSQILTKNVDTMK
ncbi:hypothetical protein CHCC14820_2979 [Bacillus paralicheniformis]|uniref:Uncharacterized protein n=1 Tax=Bacillus paralicheniformis TaxID=1648923 RepID=A0A6I7TU28_9BACI|nr:hypothetical protein SC10_B2orf06423 [Bacillus paralicheniformis]OLF95691.1 hypothetical protein B4121_1253 [Bacillus paralicheniformis]OLG05323.1 hypothetical protein B4125_3395 [Bacillus paralicheniformis]OLG06272.1 hypothetical protein B4123_3878 [Bacillus paralicheniformis]TWJ47638.1 hypothetical protein CHCC5027_4063 [Bacillus paralicheniformis]